MVCLHVRPSSFAIVPGAWICVRQQQRAYRHLICRSGSLHVLMQAVLPADLRAVLQAVLQAVLLAVGRRSG